MILTKAGDLFANGSLIELGGFFAEGQGKEYTDSFKQLDLKTVFSNLLRPGEKIIDFATPRHSQIESESDQDFDHRTCLVVITD